MKTAYFMRAFIYFILLITIISCTNQVSSNEDRSIANLATATTVNYNYKSEIKVKTSEKIEGTWESFNSGTKIKWKIQGNKIYKSMIYSFGEIGEPQVLEIEYNNKCGGAANEFGNVITLISKNSKNEKRIICYTISSSSSSEINLKSESGQKVKLVKMK